ncbi:MAG: PKD domain-containing protein, partial [Flavobacteriales bacterium]
GDGTATATVTTGTGPFTYAWSTGANTPSITAAPGTYTVVITDASNCVSPPIAGTIGTQSLPNQADAGPDLVGCVDGFPIALGGTVVNATSGQWTGGSGTFSGTWPDIGYAPSAAEIAAGSVTLTLTTLGNDNCPPASDQLVITIPNSFDGMGITTVNATCDGQTTGSASVTPALPGLTYLWSDPGGQSTPTAYNLAAGSYTVTVSDGYGCSTTLSATVTSPAPITIASLTTTAETCAGFGDGTATVTASGGTPPYSFLWSNGATTPGISTVAGTYIVGVTDVNDCAVAVGFATIDALAQPNLVSGGPDQTVCMGSYPISLQGSIQNATGAVWSGGNGTWLANGVNAQYMPSNDEILAGGLSLVISTTGNTLCPAASDTVPVSLSNAFIGASLTATHVTCNGNADGSIAFAPDAPGNSYAWNDPAAQNTPTAAGLGPGAYTIVVTDALGCDTALTAMVTQPAPLAITQFATTDASCNGGSNGTAFALVSGGTPQYAYAWSGGQLTPAVTGLAAGPVSVTVTDANGCTAQADGIINQPPPISFMAVVPDTVCVNAPVTLVAQASGGTGSITCNWGPLGTGNPITVSFAQSQSVQLSVTDQNGCMAPAQFYPVQVLDLGGASFSAYGDTTICPGGAPATVGASLIGYPGSYTITWPELGATGPGPFTVPISMDQDLTVMVTDQCGDTLQDMVQLRVQAPPEINLPPIIAQGCAPLSVTFPDLQLGPGLSYQWNLGNGQTSASPQPVLTYQAGSYAVSLTVITPIGCTSTSPASGVINAWLPPTAGFSASTYDTAADNATIDFADQSQGAIATWSWLFGDGGTGAGMHPTHTYLDVGTFTVTLTVTDVNGCTDEADAVIAITPVHDITIPTAFTPDPNSGGGGYYVDGDLSNDVFYVFARFVEDFRMRIFNRWGELIFESDDVRRGWDGYYRGQLSPQDVYVVQTWVRFVDGKEKQLLTDLTLFR